MFLSSFIAAALVSLVPQAESLSPRYEHWLNEEVVYIITDNERDRFLGLQTDQERDRFIENFWEVRDPFRETLFNEYREEHYRRVAEANRQFGRETARDGWRTERGRIYILLGAPNDVRRFPNPQNLYPLEIWSYYNLELPPLPSSLNLMFFKRRGIGEFRLYSPAFDGLGALVAGHQLAGLLGNNPFRPLPPHLLQLIERDILEAAVSVAPGHDKQGSEMVIADLNRPGVVHERMLKKLGERVEADVVFSTQMEVAFAYHSFQGQDDFTEIHFAVEVLPRDLSFSKYGDVLLGRVDIFGVLSDQVGNAIEEFQDVAEFKFTQSAFDSAQYFPFLYRRKSLLLPGRYHIELVLRDSVSRRVAVLRKTIQVAPFPESQPAASSLLLAYKVDRSEASAFESLPYQFAGTDYFPKVDATFGVGQPVFAFVNLRLPRNQQKTSVPISASYSLRGEEGVARENTHQYRAASTLGQMLPLLIPISTDGLETGRYTLEVELRDEGDNLIEVSEAELQLQAEPEILGRLIAEGKPTDDQAQKHLELGMKYYFAGRLEQAAPRLQATLDFAPHLLVARFYLGRIRAMQGDCNQAIELLSEVVTEEPSNPEAQVSLGYCLFKLERFDESAAAYQKALQYGPEEPHLLNALGESARRAGKQQQAIDAFSRSLEIKPGQAEVKAILEEIERNSGKTQR